MNKVTPIIEFDHVSFSYENKNILADVSFQLKCGEFVGVLGPNGAGKTTLLKLCNRILKLKRGEIKLEGIELSKYAQRAIAQRMAMVAQENIVPLAFSTIEVVMTGRHPFVPLLGFETDQDLMIVNQVMADLQLSLLSQRPFSTLSGGEKQRVLVATALAQTPGLLLLDEPTSALDLKHQIETYEILKKAQQQGLTILAVTHDVNLAAMFCDRLIFLKNGRIIDYGRPGDIVNTARIEMLYDVRVSIFEHPVRKTPLVFPD